MRKYKVILAACLLGFATISCADEATQLHDQVFNKDTQSSVTPEQALQRLKDGNERFTSGKMKNRDLLAQANQTAPAQHPIAVVLNCLDSRAAPEFIFDQGVGDIFVARVAGNIMNNDILGSMEFATQLAGAKLIAVIGHTNCGAVKGACQRAKLGHLTELLQKIQPAINQTTKAMGSRDCDKAEFIDEAAKNNVLLMIKQIQTRSPVISRLIKEGKLGIVGGIQDLATGKVTFLDAQAILPAK